MDIEGIKNILAEINNDRTVPRNIRESIKKAIEDLENEKLNITMRISNAIAILDEVSNDPNIPTYTRTQIWNIVSSLESINKE